jgi:hypothetical protein
VPEDERMDQGIEARLRELEAESNDIRTGRFRGRGDWDKDW